MIIFFPSAEKRQFFVKNSNFYWFYNWSLYCLKMMLVGLDYKFMHKIVWLIPIFIWHSNSEFMFSWRYKMCHHINLFWFFVVFIYQLGILKKIFILFSFFSVFWRYRKTIFHLFFRFNVSFYFFRTFIIIWFCLLFYFFFLFNFFFISFLTFYFIFLFYWKVKIAIFKLFFHRFFFVVLNTLNIKKLRLII